MDIFKNKIILVTGGTGSFGKTFVNYLLNKKTKEIRIFSRDEKKQEEMRISINKDYVKYIIGDVRDFQSINDASNNVDFIFHAAALKQVPTCEFYPMEAIKTNVIGTNNVIQASNFNQVKKLVLLSTDKAVYPINAMGMSKAMMEKLMISNTRSNNNSSTIICATRYGNVMASRGSVIPLFINQIKNKREITITDPSMTRFLMSLDESVKLVLYAFKNGETGDIFVQKSPSSTIYDLAKSIKELYKSNVKIKIIGTRHGEKLYETLVSKEEMLRVEDFGEYFKIKPDSRDLNYDKYFIEGDIKLSQVSDYTSHNTKILNINEIKKVLMKLNIIRDTLND